jgi:hypothetical protein
VPGARLSKGDEDARRHRAWHREVVRGGIGLGAIAPIVIACGSGSPGIAADTTAAEATSSTGALDDAPSSTSTTGGEPDTDTSTGLGSTGPIDPDGTSDGDGTTGGGPPVGPLVVDARHPHVFRRADGPPIFLCGPGDPEDFLHRGTQLADGTRDGDQDDLIAKLAPTGANTMYFQAVRSHGGDGDATHNPFVSGDPTLGLNEAVLDQWDGWLAAMNDAGIVPIFFLYDDSASIWSTGDVVGPEEQAFVEAIVDRFEHHPLLVWSVAEIYSSTMSPTRASAIAELIAAADSSEHPIAVHQGDGLAFDFARDPFVDSFAITRNATTPAQLHDGLASIFSAAHDEYNLLFTESVSHGAGENARAFDWAAATAGAYVTVFLQDIASTDVADLEDCGRLREFFESTRFAELTPHDELGTEGTTWVFARPAEAYILFGASGEPTLGLVELPAADWRLQWLDPAAGTRLDEVVRHPGGPLSLPVPGGFGAHAAAYLELR